MVESWNWRNKKNVWYYWPSGHCEEELRFRESEQLGTKTFDVAIVGAGVVGCALAYHLSQKDLSLIVVDKNHDVGEGTSKANSAIIHTGYDATPGTLESELVTQASYQWPALAAKLKIPFRQISALLLALDKGQETDLEKAYIKSQANGVEDVVRISGDEARHMENHVSKTARGALHIKREGIIDPFLTSVSSAEIAIENGAVFLLGFQISALESGPKGTHVLQGSDGHQISARIVINTTGLGSMKLSSTYGGRYFNINPRRGQFLLYDKQAGSLVNRILLPMPSQTTKGVLVTPTIFGNLLSGPTAEDLPPEMVEATETTAEGIEMVRQGSHRLCPELINKPVIGAYAGLRCNCKQGSYQIHFNDGREGVVTLTGIRSTGLTSSIALAEYVAAGLEEKCGLKLRPKPGAIDSRPKEAWPGWAEPRPFQSQELMAKHPDYGLMICHCEQVSRREVLNTLDSPLAPRTLDAVRRRTRVSMGRCQGFYCQIALADLIARHCGLKTSLITKKGPGSEIVKG